MTKLKNGLYACCINATTTCISYANSNYNNLIKLTENNKQFEYAHVYSLYLLQLIKYQSIYLTK